MALFSSNSNDLISSAHNVFINDAEFGMLLFDNSDILIDHNKIAKYFLSINSEILGKKINQIITNSELLQFYNSSNKVLVFNSQKHDKQFKISKSIIDGGSGTLFTITELNDQSTQRLTNEELDSVLRENEVLLAEVHHRVKNNLQLILSILNLDKRFGVKNSDEIIESTISRVTSMSIIYQKAFGVKSVSSIDVCDFIQNNIDRLINIYKCRDVEVVFDLDDDILVSTDVLSPLTFILNEIISNSIHHGYSPDQTDKKLYITLLKNTGDNTAYLIVEDNGIGLPLGLDISSNNSLGFTLINILSSQINGTVTRLDSMGTCLKVDFSKSIWCGFMLFNFNVFGIISLIGAIFSLVFFYYSITNERNILTLTLSFLTLTIFVYILASSIEILISLYPIKLVASYFSTIIYPFVFALWLLFILIYLRPKKLVKMLLLLFLLFRF